VSPQPAIVTSSPAGGSNSESGGRTIGATLDVYTKGVDSSCIYVSIALWNKEIAINYFDYLNYTIQYKKNNLLSDATSRVQDGRFNKDKTSKKMRKYDVHWNGNCTITF
jgi:hypothetical protein